MIDLKELLTTLSETSGPSGREEGVAAVIGEAWEPLVDSLSLDRVGNLIALREGAGPAPRRRLLLAAHMDEIGLIVKAIESNRDGAGFLKVTHVGGVDRRQLLGQLVTVHGSRNGDHEMPGVIGALPERLQPPGAAGKAFDYEALVVDVGLPEEVLRQRVAVGDFISFHQPLRSLLGQRVAGKALDNRASVAAVTVCLEMLGERRHDWDVLAIATAQEETVLLGGLTTAYALEPDVALAIDVTFGRGPGASGGLTYEPGKGPTISLGPNVHPAVYEALRSAAQAIELTVHDEPHARRSGTDAMGLQVARAGIPTGVIGIPLRYMHTMVESLDLRDVRRAGRLMAEFAARLDDAFLAKLQEALA